MEPIVDTERSSPRYQGIDLWDPADVLDGMIEGQFAAVSAVREARFQLERAALALAAHLSDAGRLVYVGAGTSGRLAVQDGAELLPTFNWPQDRLLLLIAGGRDALSRSVEGAEDEVEQALGSIRQNEIGAKDALIAVAASGTTPFTLACMREAKTRGAMTIGLANNRGTPILAEAGYPIFLDTGAEPIAGSTRMKAGTAQRIALSMLSSLLMIRLGRVYEGLMVDVQAVNQKLAQRSEDMLLRLSGRSRQEIRQALQTANGSVKLAMLVLRGCDLDRASGLLALARGNLRAALQLMDRSGSDAA
jgi:N-acetylmuramic acid 6-phosphate etherase